MGLESFSAPRNPVKRRLTTSTPLGYLQGYLLSITKNLGLILIKLEHNPPKITQHIQYTGAIRICFFMPLNQSLERRTYEYDDSDKNHRWMQRM